jgi:hypothetical protein
MDLAHPTLAYGHTAWHRCPALLRSWRGFGRNLAAREPSQQRKPTERPPQHGKDSDHQDQDEGPRERLPGHRNSTNRPIMSGPTAVRVNLARSSLGRPLRVS